MKAFEICNGVCKNYEALESNTFTFVNFIFDLKVEDWKKVNCPVVIVLIVLSPHPAIRFIKTQCLAFLSPASLLALLCLLSSLSIIVSGITLSFWEVSQTRA